MNYQFIIALLQLAQEFELNSASPSYSQDINGFKNWIAKNNSYVAPEPYWEGKEKGRSPESMISTLLVHMSKYARAYSKSAISDSQFSSQEDFIYLINLKAFGAMSKTKLIKKNIHDKPTGMQIINRLISKGWIIQSDSLSDKRSKVISISQKGLDILERQMGKIRQATQIVTGNLNYQEKMQLIILLSKLDDFHYSIFSKNFEIEDLVDRALMFVFPKTKH